MPTTHAVELLEQVGITEAVARLKAYPHQFSGGMRQRVVIALALAGDPDLIIADEPTTALDVSIQAQILDLIKKLCRERNLGVIIVTHDIGVIANIADRVAVMYRGEIVETGTVAQISGGALTCLHPVADCCRAARGHQAGPLYLGRLHRGQTQPVSAGSISRTIGWARRGQSRAAKMRLRSKI